MAALQTPYHHGSHCDLLWTPDGSRPGKIDAIMVPTVRPPAYLGMAAKLSRHLGCTLVTLHSGRWTSARAAADRIGSGVDLIAIDVPEQSTLRLMDFETSRLLADTRFARKTDTSAKRNLGLLLAHALGWQRIIFLDDDIQVPDPGDLQRAAGLLDTYNAVGLENRGFPDNSVVCHAFRMVGGSQKSFIGGGALAVHTSRNRSFFPEIYNEDWFYMLDPGKGIQSLAVAGAVKQSPYEPFRNADRARMEEFGDVMAEGIFWVLDQGHPLDAADARHWREFLARRRGFIEYILSHLDKVPVAGAERERVAAALRASLGRLTHIDPGVCERYLQAWITDRAGWERHIRTMRRNLPLESALRTLSKKGCRPIGFVAQRAPGTMTAAERPPGAT